MVRNGVWWCPTPFPLSVLPTPDCLSLHPPALQNNLVKCKKFPSVAKSCSELEALEKGEEAGTAQAVSPGQSVCPTSSGDAAMVKPGELDGAFR